jgi:hypothetical protein
MADSHQLYRLHLGTAPNAMLNRVRATTHCVTASQQSGRSRDKSVSRNAPKRLSFGSACRIAPSTALLLFVT